MGRFLRAVPALVAALLGCGDHAPPLLGDPPLPDASTAPQFQDEAGPPPSCNAGPDLGVCACTELNLLTDAPNLYLVLDRSGSMAEGNKWTTVRITVSQMMESLGPRANFGLAVFPFDQSACAPGGQVMGVRQGDSPAGTLGPTTKAMLSVTATIPNGGTPTSATLAGLLPVLAALPGRTFVILATDGGPNCNDAASCSSAMCIPNIESEQGCPAGGLPDCCDPNIYGPEQCLDSQPTIDAVAAIAKAGIPTYVLGVPGSAPYATLLDSLAQAGGTARTTEPYYYRVDSTDQSELGAALAQIAAKITATCTLTLDQPPPDPTHVNVYFDDKPVPADPQNGWTLAGSTITLEGTACDEVMKGQVLNVRVVAGCPTLQPN
jgi:hypothetical protein